MDYNINIRPLTLILTLILTLVLSRSEAAISSQTFCPSAFHPVGSGCYFYGHFKLNWFRAMEFCHSLGKDASLAVIETEEENKELQQWLRLHGDPSTGVWVGGSDNGHHGLWSWFPTGHLIKYFDWGLGQPSGGDQHCLYVVGGWLGYQWADFHCDFQMTFLCEYNIRKKTVWDLPPVKKVKKSRPNSKNNKQFSSIPNTKIKLFDIFQDKELTDNTEVEEDVEKEEKTKNGETLESIDDSSDPDKVSATSSGVGVIINKQDVISTTETTQISPGEGSSWALLEVIKNVIKIAFNS